MLLDVLLLASILAAPPVAPPTVSVPARVANAEGLVAADAVPRPVAMGLGFTEGPAVDEKGILHFTDLSRSEIHVLTSAEPQPLQKERPGHTAFLVNSRGMNGLAFTRDGRLLGCQGGAGALVEIDRTTKAIRPLAVSVTIDGVDVPLGRINDLAIDAAGGVYFTDPSLGRAESPTRGVLYRAVDGSTRRVDTTVGAPNGVALSPDGARLYVLSYKDPGIYAFDITAPGSLGPPSRIGDLRSSDGSAPRGRGDGLAIDRAGRLWCTNPDARQVQIFSPEGRFLGSVEFPEAPTNCTFGGHDGRTLFVTAVTSVYAITTEVDGVGVDRPAAVPPNK